MKTKRHWEYKNARHSAMLFLEELLYVHRLHSLIEYAEDEACDALGEWKALDLFSELETETRLHAEALTSIGEMLLGLEMDCLPSRRMSIRGKASRLAYEIYKNMNYVQQRKSGALRRLASMYEDDLRREKQAKRARTIADLSKRQMVDLNHVCIKPKK